MKTIGLWGVIVVVFVFSPASAQVPPDEEWSIEIVVSDVLFGNFLIFNGQPFVSFVEGGTLRYAVREATGWDVRDTGITNVTSGRLLDNNGQLALVFTRGPFGNLELFFSTFDGTRWSTPILISANVDTASIAVINGRPEATLATVAPTPPFSTELRYATFDGVSWQVEVIEPFQRVGARGLTDIGGQPAVAYNVSNIFTRYAAFDGTNWDVIEIDDTQLSYGTQLIEWNGDPLIAYSRFAPTLGEEVIAATFNGVDFDLTIAATNRSRSNGVGLALVGGQPAIAYTGNQLGYTTFDGTSWSDRTVVGPFNRRGISLGASLTLQQLANGQPAVVGNDPTAGQILFMTPDVVPPTVAPDNIPNVTESGGTSYTFTLQYTDDVFIDTATIDALDVTVLAPDGSPITTDGGTVLAAAQTNDPNTVAAQVQPDVVPAAYNIVPPGGDWDRADNGIYTVAVNVTQVADVNANFVAANPALATFIVNIIPSEDDDDDGEQEVIADAGLPSDGAAITAPPGVLAPVEVLPATGEAPFWRQYAFAAAVLAFVLGLATKMGWR